MSIVEDRPDRLTEQQDYIDGLRALADFLDENRDLTPHYGRGVDVALFFSLGDEPAMAKVWLADKARRFGKAEKSKTSPFYEVARRFGPHKLSANVRENLVCEQVHVGTRTVEREVLPPGVEMVTETVKEPVYEWRCPPSLLEAARNDEEGGA